MKEIKGHLVSKMLKLGLILGALLLTAESCYTPWHKAQAEKQAVAQLAVIEKSIYVPPDTILLAEARFSGRGNDSAFAVVERVYSSPLSCAEIIAKYREKMAASGWYTIFAGDCNKTLWLTMRTPDDRAGLGLDANPGTESRLADKWPFLQKRYQGLYFVSFGVDIWYKDLTGHWRILRV